MTPSEWDSQQIPQGATRHALSISMGKRVFYNDTSFWNGFAWVETSDAMTRSSPLSEKPFLKTSATKGSYILAAPTPIHSRFD